MEQYKLMWVLRMSQAGSSDLATRLSAVISSQATLERTLHDVGFAKDGYALRGTRESAVIRAARAACEHFHLTFAQKDLSQLVGVKNRISHDPDIHVPGQFGQVDPPPTLEKAQFLSSVARDMDLALRNAAGVWPKRAIMSEVGERHIAVDAESALSAARFERARAAQLNDAVPAVTRAEVELAVELICGLYEPLQAHSEALLSFALDSRQNAHAIVQMSWVISKIEFTVGSEDWYHNVWMPAAKQAKNGEKMADRTPEGLTVCMGRAERDVLIATIAPVFNAPERNLEAEKAVAKCVIGRFGSAIRTSLRILKLVAGEKGYGQFKAQLEEARRSEVAAIAAGAAASETGESEEDAEVESHPFLGRG